MNICFFFFRSRYRYSHVGNLFVTRRAGRLFFIPVVGIWAVLLEPLLHLLAGPLNFSLVYTDKEFPCRHGRFRLWWNTPEEMGTDYLDRAPLMVCGNPIQALPRCQFYPVLENRVASPGKVERKVPRAVYMGEVLLPTDPAVLAAWQFWRRAMLDDLALITRTDFWAQNLQEHDSAMRYAMYRGFSNLIRYECLLALHQAGVPVDVYGSQWQALGIPSRDNMYDPDERRRIYRENLCLDFGSKSGCDSLYQRTIEVIENSGLLIQVRRADSDRVFGTDLVARMTFNRVADLPKLVATFLQDSSSCQDLQTMLHMRFADNKNLDLQAEYSLAAVMGADS